MADCDLSVQPSARNNTTTYPNSKFPDEVDPSTCPPIYASYATGRCLEPVFDDGECLAFATGDDCMPGDFVGIWLRPDVIASDELPRRVKRLRSIMPGLKFPHRPSTGDGFMPLVELEQFNPPRVLRVPADHILAMHKVVGTAIQDKQGRSRLVPLSKERLDRMADFVLVDFVRAGVNHG